MLNVFPDVTIEDAEVRDLGDLTLGVAHARGHGAGSDTLFDEMVWGVTSGVTGNASGLATTGLKRKPSKPWSCGSRRCRRRPS